MEECPGCHRRFRRLLQHLECSPSCQQAFDILGQAMIAGQRSQFNPHQSLADEQSRCGSLGEYKVGDEESDEHTFTVLQHGGDQQVLTNKHVPLPTLRSLLGEATGSVRQTEPEARRSSPATRTSSRAVNASRLTGASRAATGTSSSDDEATQQGGVVVAT